MLEKGTFRKDIYYRLKGAWLHLPPLRDRKEDIPLLVNRFLREFRGHDAPNGIEEEALSVLMEHNYPGNVRELRSILQSAVNLAQDRPISIHFLPGNIRKRKKVSRHRVPETTGPITPLWEVEKAYILRVYEQAGRNKAQASDLLGIGLNTLRRKLKLYGEE
jgi:transcriptional regulator with PAS, ATPase and Fis domain